MIEERMGVVMQVWVWLLSLSVDSKYGDYFGSEYARAIVSYSG
jgi:cytochrome c oxidase subunit IV